MNTRTNEPYSSECITYSCGEIDHVKVELDLLEVGEVSVFEGDNYQQVRKVYNHLLISTRFIRLQ